MPLPSMRARLISATMAGNSWGTYGGGAQISEAQAVEIVENVLAALTTPDEAMCAVGDRALFIAMIEAAKAQRPKAHIVAAATVVGDYSTGIDELPVIGDYSKP